MAARVLRARSRSAVKQARDTAIVIGECQSDVDGHGHTILLIGDCAQIKGEARGKTRRIKGCPVAIPVFVMTASHYCKMPSVYVDRDYVVKYPYHFAVSFANKFINRVLR